MRSAPTPEPARIDELADAFRLIFRHLSPEERDARVRNALHLIERRELDPRGVFVVRGPGGLAGTLACSPVPGAGGILWPPAVAGEHPGEAEDALVRHACAWLRGQGARLAQALLAPADEALAAPLVRNGVAHVTNLWYLRHDLVLDASLLGAPPRLDFEAYHPESAAAFQDTLRRTYEQSLDCPEVNGARTMDEVIEGHRAQGLFDPDRWWLARAGGRPVGVLIVTELPESSDWEVAYMGVVPEARRQGAGRELLLWALCEARAAGAPRLTLSVDARNLPAWELYRRVGFEPFDRRAVYLVVWG
jgi:ribosomal protein S18 acetylase RimI-like enzyme